MTRALPVCGKSDFRRSDQPGARFSTVEMARDRTRVSPERRAEIRVEKSAFKQDQFKAPTEERHLPGRPNACSRRTEASCYGRWSRALSRRISCIGNVLILQQLPCDDQTLNLAGAFADGAQLHVAVELLGWVVFDEPVATVDLDA